MTQKFANAARAYLASSISDSATTVTIDGGGSLFPAITSPEFSRAVLQDANGIEVVLITAHTAGSDSFTVTRAQEGTTARSFAANSVFGLRMTAADGDTFVAKVSGPSSATDNALVRFDSTTGKLAQNSVAILSDAGALSGLTDISASGAVTLSGGTANGVAYLNGSKVLTSGSALVFDGTNFGVGGSPSAWGGAGATRKAIQNGAASFVETVAAGATGTQVYSNAYVDSNNDAKFILNGYATAYQQFAGFHSWLTSTVSGSAGGTALFANRMSLDTSGNLLVAGTSSAQQLSATNGLLVNSATIAADYTIPSGSNAMSAGPVSINSGITVTVSSGSTWVVV